MPSVEFFPTTARTRSSAVSLAVDRINSLPHLPRLVLMFAYCEGMTMAEIGRSLGVAEERVRTMHDEALRQLRNSLAA